jgi:hypothetical protein
MKPPVCYNCGAPWKPKCEYCGTEYGQPAFVATLPVHNPEYMSLAQMQAASLSAQKSRSLEQAFGIGLLGSILGGFR